MTNCCLVETFHEKDISTIPYLFSFHPDNSTIAFHGKPGKRTQAKLIIEFASIGEKRLRIAPFRIDHEAEVVTHVEPAFCFLPNGKGIAYASVRDASIEIWPLPKTTAAQPVRLVGHRDTVQAITITKDAALAATVSLDKSMRIWGLPPEKNTQHETVQLPNAYCSAEALEFSGNQELVGVVYTVMWRQAVQVVIYNRTNRSFRTYDIPNNGCGDKIRAACFLSNLNSVLVGDEVGNCSLWDLRIRKPLCSWQFDSEICCIAKNSDESMIVVGTWDGTLHLIRPIQQP